jgi:hypothetical protein
MMGKVQFYNVLGGSKKSERGFAGLENFLLMHEFFAENGGFYIRIK